MKIIKLALIAVIGLAFLFVSCEREFDTENIGSKIHESKGNDNDQGENEGNGKKPPIVIPPCEDEEKPPIIDTPKTDFQIVGIWICETIGISSARYWRISVSDDMSFIWQRSLDGKNWLPDIMNGNVTVNDEIISLIFSNGEIHPITVIDQNKIKILGMVWIKQQIIDTPIVEPPVVNPPEKDVELVDSLFEEYGLSLGFVGIWNDFMPGGGWQLTPEGERASIFTAQITSKNPLPPMIVYANVITDTVRFDNVLLYDIYSKELIGKVYQQWDGTYLGDFRPVVGFRIGGNYVIELIVKIGEKKQMLEVKGKTFATM